MGSHESRGITTRTLRVLAVAGVLLIVGVGFLATRQTASRADDAQLREAAAAATAQQIADPILMLCQQGGETGAKLGSAGLCDRAADIRATPVPPLPLVSPPSTTTVTAPPEAAPLPATVTVTPPAPPPVTSMLPAPPPVTSLVTAPPVTRTLPAPPPVTRTATVTAPPMPPVTVTQPPVTQPPETVTAPPNTVTATPTEMPPVTAPPPPQTGPQTTPAPATSSRGLLEKLFHP